MNQWGHLKLKSILSNPNLHSVPLNQRDYYVCQFSSIGSLGSTPAWLEKEFGSSLCPTGMSLDSLKLVYPTVDNVRNSLEGWNGMG